MKRILITWLGRHDLLAAGGRESDPGPVRRLLEAVRFDFVFLLDDLGGREMRGQRLPTAEDYAQWAGKVVPALSETCFEAIPLDPLKNSYSKALAVTDAQVHAIVHRFGREAEYHMLLSPGPPACQTALVLVNRNVGARLWATWHPDGDERGVEEVQFPVHITVDDSPATLGALARPGTEPEELDPAFATIWGTSHALRHALLRAQRVARLDDVPVLLTGETGTGKELVARALHDASPRRQAPFNAVNCAGFPPELLEVELFGCEEGSFTGATERAGLLRETDGGTVLLDEIGEMPAKLQAKLLRALQEKRVRPVGATKEVRFDVRVISATHRDVASDVRAGRFRADLYHRIAVFPVHLPPLRLRGGDVRLLVERLLDRLAPRLGPIPTFTPGALQALERRSWPGNVRELENALLRLVLTSLDPVDEADVARELAVDRPFRTDGPPAELRPREFLTRLAGDLDELLRRHRLGDALEVPTEGRFEGPAGLRAYLDALLNDRARRAGFAVQGEVPAPFSGALARFVEEDRRS